MSGFSGSGPDKQSAHSDTEVEARPKRRRFAASYKLQILKKADACKDDVGEIGKLLRSEGLYSSHLSEWRKQREQGALNALERKRGRKSRQGKDLELENERLRRENERLRSRLEKAEIVIGVQKKVSELLGIPLNPTDSAGSDS